MNDLPEFLEKGGNFEGVKVKILLYADDILLKVPKAEKLQVMNGNLDNVLQFSEFKSIFM